MNRIKKLVAGVLLSMILGTSANAWLIDGEDYILLNGGAGLGKIKDETISSQFVAFELGRNFTRDWYGSLVAEYSVYSIETDNNSNLTFGTRSGSIALKVGFRPTKHTLVYALGGMAGDEKLFGPVFGAGYRWDVFRNLGIFTEISRTSIASSSVTDDSYVVNSGRIGLQLFLRY